MVGPVLFEASLSRQKYTLHRSVMLHQSQADSQTTTGCKTIQQATQRCAAPTVGGVREWLLVVLGRWERPPAKSCSSACSHVPALRSGIVLITLSRFISSSIDRPTVLFFFGRYSRYFSWYWPPFIRLGHCDRRKGHWGMAFGAEAGCTCRGPEAGRESRKLCPKATSKSSKSFSVLVAGFLASEKAKQVLVSGSSGKTRLRAGGPTLEFRC